MTRYPCPQCKQDVTWSNQNPYRPFCSERCKLIDLGSWADGSYAIPATPQVEDFGETGEDSFFIDPDQPPAH
ncbi:DNA gyrase inhibitor YacG [Balneatrix alpica]|uniref:DNA gyrase inhibitor YacG n=1 Tax=Balneatrix alpica TaxID=75684 RepID=UPI00273A0DC5|nr:DNA gyrase inhibitor YacG [Balneatrix alpica]